MYSIVPSVSATPASSFIVVVLPAPLRPTQPAFTPLSIRNDASDTNVRAPILTDRWEALITSAQYIDSAPATPSEGDAGG